MTTAKYGAILQYKLLLLLIDLIYLWSLWSIAWNLKTGSELMMHFTLLTVLMTGYASVYWVSIHSQRLRYWPVHILVLQGILLIAISLIVNTIIISLSLYLILVIYVVDSLAQAQPGREALACYLFLFLLSVSLTIIQFAYWHMGNSWAYFTPLFLCIGGYCVLFLRQAYTNERAQRLLQNLEAAHTQLEAAHAQLAAYAIEVEELTLINERQRMARELHDTLTQGLAGLILQLEAVDGCLAAHREGRAREIVQQSIIRARSTFKEARSIISDLRTHGSEQRLAFLIEEEIKHFFTITGIPCITNFHHFSAISSRFHEHVSRAIAEGLTNVARHAQARHVWITVSRKSSAIVIEIRDDGNGFDVARVTAEARHTGRYGLLGLHERANLVGGHLEIISEQGKGTSLRFSFPDERIKYA